MATRKSGPSGRHESPRRKLSAPRAAFKLMDLAAEHAGDPNWCEWARDVLVIAAADELGLDPLDTLERVRDAE